LMEKILPDYLHSKRAPLGLGRTFQIPRPFSSASVRENVAIGAMFGTFGRKKLPWMTPWRLQTGILIWLDWRLIGIKLPGPLPL